ncbi:hypothetical protein A1Q2_00377 [Trichosporon asahii var. asahii CBS 8904]|uniref:Uncharacterized protein n=2 Tax=Trichosporon asahii var. asahii TaxID=189963 RepID=K1WX66_TRIAC|nr:hypothetical protein A1Q1_04759 [Trichosporon asahii var. asahii CBS 2479]EJT46582.1 hypothetical protein A1Q1_04759 [Trichosporon asahii var. asahii CBS 2479]EKD05314.1 hypothetical protein A1Q2_00377 [Trichosporon asahii var. asahii CBS 8904]
MPAAISYGRYAAAWHHILWDAEYATQLAFRLVSRGFCAAIDDILCSERLVFDSLNPNQGVRAWGHSGPLPCFHPDGPTQAQVKAVQKARVLVFRADAYPPIGALCAHAAAGTKLALTHTGWWPINVDIPAEVSDIAFLAQISCACDLETVPQATLAHSATSVTVDLDLTALNGARLPHCHLFTRWWSPSVERLCISLTGSLAAMKAAPRQLLSRLTLPDRKRLKVTVLIHDVELSKLDHRWMDKEFEMLGVQQYEVFSVDCRTGAVADEKHHCYEFEWAWLDWHAERMRETEEQVKEQTYVPPSKRNASKQSTTIKKEGPYQPPGKRKQAEHTEQLAELLARATECSSNPKPTELPNPMPCPEPDHVPTWRRADYCRAQSYQSVTEPEDEYVDMPDHFAQVPIALGGAHYALGNYRFVLSAEMVHQGQRMDERFQPLEETIDVALWEETYGFKSNTAEGDGLGDASLDRDAVWEDEVSGEVISGVCVSPRQKPANKHGRTAPKDGDPEPPSHRRKLQRLKSWASISSDSDASVIPIEI